MRVPIRLSVRLLMIIVLVIGAGLGWIILPAQIQRNARVTIQRAGGRVSYDWELSPLRIGDLETTQPNLNGRPSWPAWLIRALGPDYFGTIKAIYPHQKTNDADMTSIGNLGEVEFLYFHDGSELSDVGMDQLKNFPRLKHFILGPCPKASGAGLSSLVGANQLQLLELGGNNIDDTALTNVKGFSNLLDLNLSRTRVTDAGLANLEGLVKLESLRFNRDQVTSGGLIHLRGMSRLKSLSLRMTGVQDLKPIGQLTKLERLLLAFCPIDDAGLAPVGQLTSLKSLELRDTRITDAGLVSLRGLRSLEYLDLENTKVSDAGLAYLEDLTSINHLNLGGTQVADAGLAYLKGLSSLRFLDLTKTQVTDGGLEPLKELPSLEVLNLFGSRATKAGTAALRRSRPKMRITP